MLADSQHFSKQLCKLVIHKIILRRLYEDPKLIQKNIQLNKIYEAILNIHKINEYATS